ncbi:MAG TPA: AMP-binding protein [Holophaga sp.]|nr:AMP-binding protein [Holophaga sp.]HPS66391.1 AMP-binding protein [Holophaga sp.]
MISALFSQFCRAVLRLRYSIEVFGLEDVAAKGAHKVLFLPNHPALVDPVIVLSELYRRFQPRSLADKDQISPPGVNWLARKMGACPMPDVAKYGEASRPEMERVLAECVEGLKAGGNLLLYPGGHLMHGRYEDLGGASAVETLLERVPDARVVLVRTRGLWGSSFSWAAGQHPHLVSALRRGAGFLLANFLFFSPRRRVSLEFLEPEDLPRAKGRVALNRYMEAYFNDGATPNTYVPHTFWEGSETQVLPEPEPPRIEGDIQDVPAGTRELVIAHLREMTGQADIPVEASLARDLGMDSLGRMELQMWLEQEFGFQDIDPESLRTVSDAMLAACGRTVGIGPSAMKPIPAAWFRPSPVPVGVPPGTTLAEVFLNQAARGPDRVLAADQAGGARTFRDVITGILALRPVLAGLEGTYVGLMLPASSGVTTLFMALIFAGKIPVMVNWTVGSRNLVHGLDLLGVRHVLTAGPLVAKLEAQGTDLAAIKGRFLLLEDVGRRLGRLDKLAAFLKARISWAELRKAPVRETAVVLFTSGSESLPKAVPLTHGNLLANLRDSADFFTFSPDERMIGILPPFHSFGLSLTVLMPSCIGFRVVYHPNPTEGLALARITEAYGVTMLVGTPTFLHGIARAARDQQLKTLRTVVTGGEKCPESLYEFLDRRWPGLTVMEGYGITECSPVVSCNKEEDPRHGSIGLTLGSVEHAVVDLETGERVEPGRTGMFLVRGPSIFGGYLHYDGPSPFVAFEGKSWYRTGDLVRREPDGVFYFAGRLKRFVKLGGEMVSLPAVEEALLARFGREDDKEVVLAVEATPVETNPELVLFTLREISREAANTTIREAGLSAIHNIRLVRRLEKIPVLGNGKTDYRALKGMLGETPGSSASR